MVKTKPHIFPTGLVYIKTHNETFDCIARIKSYDKGEYDQHKDSATPFYIVHVVKYTKGNYSSIEQKYYIHEIKELLGGKLNKKTIDLLYTGD